MKLKGMVFTVREADNGEWMASISYTDDKRFAGLYRFADTPMESLDELIRMIERLQDEE